MSSVADACRIAALALIGAALAGGCGGLSLGEDDAPAATIARPAGPCVATAPELLEDGRSPRAVLVAAPAAAGVRATGVVTVSYDVTGGAATDETRPLGADGYRTGAPGRTALPLRLALLRRVIGGGVERTARTTTGGGVGPAGVVLAPAETRPALLPAAPFGVGASWRTVTCESISGVPVQATTTLRVTGITDDAVEVVGTVALALDPGRTSLDAGGRQGTVLLLRGFGSAGGSISLVPDRAGSSWRRARVDLEEVAPAGEGPHLRASLVVEAKAGPAGAPAPGSA